MSQWLRRFAPAELFVYAMIFVSPLIVYRLPFEGVSLNLQRLFLVLALGAWVVHRLVKRDFSLPDLRAVLPTLGVFALLIAYWAVQLPFTRQPGYAYQFVALLIGGFVIVSTIALILNTTRKLKIGVLVFIASSLIPLGVGLYQGMAAAFAGFTSKVPFARTLSYDPRFIKNVSTTIQGERIPRIPGTLGSPSFFGEFLVYVILFLGLLLIYKRLSTPRTLLTGVLLSVSLFCLIATISRSAWLLMALGLVLVVFHARRRLWAFLKGRGWVVPGIAAGTVALLMVANFPLGLVADSSLDSVVPGYEPQFSSYTPTLIAAEKVATESESGESQSGLERSTESHLKFRAEAVGMFLENPVFGVGLGNFGDNAGQPERLSSAHAYGFTFLAEGGIVGVAVLLLFMGSFLVPVRRALRREGGHTSWRPYLLGIYICLLLLMFDNLLIYNTLLRDTSWILLGLGLVAIRTFLSMRDTSSR
jgi:O-antigen ligase